MFGRKKAKQDRPTVRVAAPPPIPGPDDIPPVFRGNADYNRRQMEFLWRVGRGDVIDRRFLGIWDQVFGTDGQSRDEIDDFLRGNRIRAASPAELLEAAGTVADLKLLAERAGVAKSGKKAELAARVAAALPPAVLEEETGGIESYRLTDVGEALVAGARALWKAEERKLIETMLEALRRGDPTTAARAQFEYDDRQVFRPGMQIGGDGSPSQPPTIKGDPVADLLRDPAFDGLTYPAEEKLEIAARIVLERMRGVNPREWTRFIEEAIGTEFRHPEVEAFLGNPVGGMVVGMDASPSSQLFLFTHTVAFRAAAREDLERMLEWGIKTVEIMPVGDDCPVCSKGPHKFSAAGPVVELPRHWGCRCVYVSGDRMFAD